MVVVDERAPMKAVPNQPIEFALDLPGAARFLFQSAK
jgi:hypothetical protein